MDLNPLIRPRPLRAGIAALALVSCTPAAPALPEAPSDGVMLFCAEPRRDFGRVWEGEVLEHEFRLRVLGVEDLVVENVRADCGCTVAELERIDAAGERVSVGSAEPIAPESELALRLRYDTHGRRGSTDRVVKLYCNEPDGVFEVSIGATVDARFETEPDPPPWIQTSLGQSGVNQFIVRGVQAHRFRLEHEASGLPPTVQVELEPIDPGDAGDANSWRVRLTSGPRSPRGTHTYPVHLRARGLPGLADDGFATYVPFVTVRVLGAFSATPPTISFGGVRQAEVVSRTVRISCHDSEFSFAEPSVTLAPIMAGKPFGIEPTARIHTRAVDGENAWDVELVLHGLAQELERTFLAKLVIETAHGIEPQLEVNVSGFRLDGGAGG